MTTIHTRRTTLTVRAEDCFEELDLGTARRWVAECDAAGLPDCATVRVAVHGDGLYQLVAETTSEHIDSYDAQEMREQRGAWAQIEQEGAAA